MRIRLQRLGLIAVLFATLPAIAAPQQSPASRPPREHPRPERHEVRPHAHHADERVRPLSPHEMLGAQQQAASQTPALPPSASEPSPPQASAQQAAPSAPVPPQVTYENGLLSISATNSTLADVLNAVKSKTGADLELPANASRERVAVQLGPGPPRDVLSRLLDGSPYNYVLLGAPNQPDSLSQIVLTPASGSAAPAPGAAPVAVQNAPLPAEPADEEPEDQAANPPTQGQEAPPPPPGAAMPAEQNSPAEGAAPGAQTPQGNPVKTPEQLLQELQRMQQREQQQQPPRQPQQKPPQ